MERRTVSHSSLDSAHVAAPDVGRIRKGLLRQLLVLTDLPDAVAQATKGRVFGGLPRLSWHDKGCSFVVSFQTTPDRTQRFGPNEEIRL